MAKRKDGEMCECSNAKITPVKSSLKMDGTPRKPNAWVQFVNEYAISENITYSSALGDHYNELKKEYAKSKKMPKKPRAKKAVAMPMPMEMPVAMPVATPMIAMVGGKKRKIVIKEKTTEKM